MMKAESGGLEWPKSTNSLGRLPNQGRINTVNTRELEKVIEHYNSIRAPSNGYQACNTGHTRPVLVTCKSKLCASASRQ